MPYERREKQVEQRLVERTREHNGTAYKFTSPGRRAVPDRLVLAPCLMWTGQTHFVECKAPGKKLTKPQEREKAKLEKLGCAVHMVDDYEPVDKFFETYCDGSCK